MRYAFKDTNEFIYLFWYKLQYFIIIHADDHVKVNFVNDDWDRNNVFFVTQEEAEISLPSKFGEWEYRLKSYILKKQPQRALPK